MASDEKLGTKADSSSVELGDSTFSPSQGVDPIYEKKSHLGRLSSVLPLVEFRLTRESVNQCLQNE
jgi:hypothetical protein